MPRGELQALGEGVHDHCVTNDIDPLATALYVKADDLLKQYPDLAPWRPKIGLQPRLTDAELVTLAVMQALLGYASESRWLRYAQDRKSTRLNSSHPSISYAVFCLKKKK